MNNCYFERKVSLEIVEEESIFLWGPRQSGKSTLLEHAFPDAKYYDLLKSEVLERYMRRPSLLREELQMMPDNSLVIIDEIQRVPELLDEVHWLMTHKNMRFILSGSSARKLKRRGANTLGGRAIEFRLLPLVSAEIPDFDLVRAVNNGMIPRHYLVKNARLRLGGYIGVYLTEEIKQESLVRNLPSFNRFLEVAAFTNGEQVNYTNIAQDCGVKAATIKEYFSILQETLVGYMIPSYVRRQKRRMVQAPRFYYFDCGVVNFLRKRYNLTPGSEDFGHSLEHLVMQELMAYLKYRHQGELESEEEPRLSYWRTSSGLEVDFIIGDGDVAVEVKSTEDVMPRNLKGIQAFKDDNPAARCIVASLDPAPRILNGIEIMPATYFLQQLWADKIIPL